LNPADGVGGKEERNKDRGVLKNPVVLSEAQQLAAYCPGKKRGKKLLPP